MAAVLSGYTNGVKGRVGVTAHKPQEQTSVLPWKKEHDAVNKIKAAILSHGNPFDAEGDQIYNFVIHVSQESVPQILNGDVSLWTPVKKQNSVMFLSGSKKQTVKVRDQSVDLKETKELYARYMVLARSNRDIDQKDAVGNYEFNMIPRALYWQVESHTLPGKAGNESNENAQTPAFEEHVDEAETSSAPSKNPKMDGMVLVQQMTKKPGIIRTVKDLGQWQAPGVDSRFDEAILVFDTYKADSLKHKTRGKRRQGTYPIQYQNADDTNIKHIHEKTKADLTKYFAPAVLKNKANSQRLVMTSASGRTRSNRGMQFE